MVDLLVRCRGCGKILQQHGETIENIFFSSGIPPERKRSQEMEQIKKGVSADLWGYCDKCFEKEPGTIQWDAAHKKR